MKATVIIMNTRHSLSFFLAAVLLLSGLVSCSADTPDSSMDTGAPAGTDSPAETEPAVNPLSAADFVPDDIRYDGQTFTILHGNGWNYTYDGYITSPYNEVAPDPDTVAAGDIINEAVVKRNRMTEEKLGIHITSVEKPCHTFNQDISLSVMAGDNAYDAVCGTVSTVFDCAVEGLLTPLSSIETLDLTHPWWDWKVMEQYSYGENHDVVYFINGDINYLDNYGSELITFNKTLIGKYGLEDPYQLVRDHTWTFDKMMEMCRDLYQDLDNDGAHSFEDQYGFAASVGVLDRMIPAAGLSVTVPLNTTQYTVNETEAFMNALDHFYDSLINHNSTWFDGGDYAGLFGNGRALFAHNLLSAVPGYGKNMEDDFGVLPFPLYEESQEHYYAPINSMYGSAYAVITTADPERAGYVLDVMGAFSADTVTEAVIDKTCLIKSIRDEDTAEMLHIVFDGTIYPGNSIEEWGNTYTTLLEIISKKKNNFASRLAGMKKRIEKESEKEISILANPEA
ncbi:MAG: extracellular solute-binding protein [Clostridia bacterium]|nr:extracellular solute-binding protein [Clostridia bacterium]